MRRRGMRLRRKRWWPLAWQLEMNASRRRRMRLMPEAFWRAYLRQRALNDLFARKFR